MGDYFLLKKFERATEKFYTRVVEENDVALTEENKKLFEAAGDMQAMSEEMISCFVEEKQEYEAEYARYLSNKQNGYYDKGFGIIEGWWFEKIYFAIHFRRYEEYFRIIEESKAKLDRAIIRLRFKWATEM